MRLSTNFTLAEFTKSQTATRKGLDNTPGIPDSGWVHVSYKSEGNRKSILTAMKENGKTVYKPGLIQ